MKRRPQPADGLASPSASNRWPGFASALSLALVFSLYLLNVNFPRPFLSLGLGARPGNEDATGTPYSKTGRPPYSNGRTDEVQWDGHSLILKGQRVFIHSGEFHTFRLPVPSLWRDILEKFKAAGLNAVSLYTHMGLLNPSRGVIDMDGFRALQPFFDAASAVGLWVVLRPGPYINAETTAGGLPHWMTTEIAGQLRTNATDFTEAWQDYIRAIIEITVPNQITRGGSVIAVQIDNEYTQYMFDGRGAEYYAILEEAYHESDIVVPLTYNDPGRRKNFVNGTGSADIYGFDEYPQSFDCSHPDKWNAIVESYDKYHQETNPSQPLYIPEFQGGAYDPWGPNAPGYQACRQLTGPDFESVFHHGLWAANSKMINYYMVYGGTSWGGIPFPGVYTSYDYGAALTESRQLTPKYTELKSQGLFLRSSPEFYYTDVIGTNLDGTVSVSDRKVHATLLRNPDTNASFYITRQLDSTSTATCDFRLSVDTSLGALVIPQVVPAIELSGRQSKVVVTNYAFGGSRVLYTTASVFFAGKIGERDVLFLHGDARHAHEASLVLLGKPNPAARASNPLVQIIASDSAAPHTIVFLAGISGLVTVWDSDAQLVLFADSATVGAFWAPALGGASPHGEYWQLGTNSSVLVGGPYLVRSAHLHDGLLALRGDLESDVRLILIAPPTVRRVSWNGQLVAPDVSASAELTGFGGLVAQLSAGVAPINVPKLKGWRYADSLPEIRAGFSDKNWTIADRRTTNIPYPPRYGDGTVLYGCDYGFCENVVIWRGHFNGTARQKSVKLMINGGEAFAASVWLNGNFLKTTYGNSSNNENIISETDAVYNFPDESVLVGEDNVITVVQDNMGLEMTQKFDADTSKSPRGIRGFELDHGTFSHWKVQGKVGGYTGYPDRARGVLNEGGLAGERHGWHLPNFDTSAWRERVFTDGLSDKGAGLGFFVTTFELRMPADYDVPLAFVFDNESQPYRALLFVNGWMMGKRVANLGPQYWFPVPEGILDYHGTNTVAVALWVMEDVRVSPDLRLEIQGIYDGGVGDIQVHNTPWSPKGREG